MVTYAVELFVVLCSFWCFGVVWGFSSLLGGGWGDGEGGVFLRGSYGFYSIAFYLSSEKHHSTLGFLFVDFKFLSRQCIDD